MTTSEVPESGFGVVVDPMAAGLEERQDWPVARVELSDEGVAVTSSPGKTEVGSQVVVAVPLGVLKNDLPTFTPPLPAEQTGAVRRLGFGRYERVALRFDEAFWHRAWWSHLVLFPPGPTEPASGVSDLNAFGGGPTLVCHTFHSATGHLADASAAASARWVLGMLSAALGCRAQSRWRSR